MKSEFYEKFPERLQYWLDQGYGKCLLEKPELKVAVENALRYFDGVRYDLDEFVVMPNHVHVLITPKNKHELSSILHSWKSFTSNEINKQTGQAGILWQKESFDHIVRNPAQLEKIRQYIREHSAYEDKRQDGATLWEDKRQDAASTFWKPAAGTFEGWPKRAAELKILDPCCGSGHFLVAALYHLVPIRMAEEGLTARQACDAVLKDNLHGLEIDERCTQIAAFALALAAWTYPGAGGYRPLPELRIACSGIAPNTRKRDWVDLAGGDERLRNGMARLYDLFRDAPILGSLIDPGSALENNLLEAGFDELRPLLEKAMSAEKDNYEKHELGVAACGIADAVKILGGRYHLIITNVPYLARGKQIELLKGFCGQYYKEAKNDLAAVFLDRLLRLNSPAGTTALVLPQNWLFLTTYGKFRNRLLKTRRWELLAQLGEGGFENSQAAGAFTTLLVISAFAPAGGHAFAGLDAIAPRTAQEKARLLRDARIKTVGQAEQLKNPDARVVFTEGNIEHLLEQYAVSLQGIATGDYMCFGRCFWEITYLSISWVFQQSTVENTQVFGGREHLLLWEDGKGELKKFISTCSRTRRLGKARRRSGANERDSCDLVYRRDLG